MTIGTDGCSAMARIRGSVFAKDVEFPRVAIFATGGFVALSIVSYLALSLGQPLLVPSFGATAVILFSMPDSRAARPRNVFFGQVISAFVSLVVSHVLGCTWYAVGLGVMLAMGDCYLMHNGFSVMVFCHRTGGSGGARSDRRRRHDRIAVSQALGT